jgi:hypothetical protein
MKKAVLFILVSVLSVSVNAQSDSIFRIMRPVVIYNSSDAWFKVLEDGYILKDRKMMTVKKEIFTTMDKDITLSNGTVVKSSGSYKEIGGTKILFKEGDFMDLQGVYFPMKQYK